MREKVSTTPKLHYSDSKETPTKCIGRTENIYFIQFNIMSSMQGINLTGGCAKCGGKRWEYFENTSDEFIQEFRCIELTCGYQDLRYSDGQFISHKTPEVVQEFLEDYDLLEEKEEEECSL